MSKEIKIDKKPSQKRLFMRHWKNRYFECPPKQSCLILILKAG
jgi:hypothetical protein